MAVLYLRRKNLIVQNTELFNQLKIAELNVEHLKGELEEKDKQINELKQEIERLLAKINATKPLQELEAKITRQANIEKDVEYGAAVIGKTVVEAAKFCNQLTSSNSGEDVKELVNLILGRTEVAKAEILKIVSSQAELETKKQAIDQQYEKAVAYFSDIMAQNN